jgi:hypothetical protein
MRFLALTQTESVVSTLYAKYLKSRSYVIVTGKDTGKQGAVYGFPWQRSPSSLHHGSLDIHVCIVDAKWLRAWETSQ